MYNCIDYKILARNIIFLARIFVVDRLSVLKNSKDIAFFYVKILEFGIYNIFAQLSFVEQNMN
jgi:hypothetical protein